MDTLPVSEPERLISLLVELGDVIDRSHETQPARTQGVGSS